MNGFLFKPEKAFFEATFYCGDKMKSKRHLLILGQLSFASAMVIKHFLPEGNIFSFMEGFFIGLTIVGHTAFLLSLSARNFKRTRILF